MSIAFQPSISPPSIVQQLVQVYTKFKTEKDLQNYSVTLGVLLGYSGCRLTLPPRITKWMESGVVIYWRDVVVSFHFSSKALLVPETLNVKV
jgi:hypothetical protein